MGLGARVSICNVIRVGLDRVGVGIGVGYVRGHMTTMAIFNFLIDQQNSTIIINKKKA